MRIYADPDPKHCLGVSIKSSVVDPDAIESLDPDSDPDPGGLKWPSKEKKG